MISVVRSLVRCVPLWLAGSACCHNSDGQRTLGLLSLTKWLEHEHLHPVKADSHIRKHYTADVRISCLIYCNKNTRNLLRSEVGWRGHTPIQAIRNLRIIKALRNIRVMGWWHQNHYNLPPGSVHTLELNRLGRKSPTESVWYLCVWKLLLGVI